MTTVERRRSTRYPLRLPIQVALLHERGNQLQGQTRDLSSVGVLFQTPEPLEVGSPVEYTIDLMSNSSLQLRCRGRVVRTGSEGAGVPRLLAATLEQYEFVR